MTELQNFLSIKSKTWTRDSHGLFDYECTTVKENILIVQKATTLIRKKHDVKEKDQVNVNDPIDESIDQKVCEVDVLGSKYNF